MFGPWFWTGFFLYLIGKILFYEEWAGVVCLFLSTLCFWWQIEIFIKNN